MSDAKTEGVEALDAAALYRACDLDAFEFETTADVESFPEVPGQERASQAVRFGIGMRGDGFNIFALGPEEAEKRKVVRHFVDERAAEQDPPSDLCYVNNFEEDSRPRALALPPGTGRRLSSDVDRILEELADALEAAFESEEYQNRRQAIQEEAGQEQQEAMEALQEKAEEKGLALLRTPAGFTFAPKRDDEIVTPDELSALEDEERERLESDIEEMQNELQDILRQMPGQQRNLQDRLRELNREIARYTIRDMLEELREEYGELSEVQEYLDVLEDDVVDNVQLFMQQDQGQGQRTGPGGGRRPPGAGGSLPWTERPEIRRYRVNVLVDHEDAEHAPVVYLDHPTYQNLVGRVEYLPMQGALVTDFNMICPGALHRANGGYLLLDARRILLQPFAWEGLKRALQSRELRIESPQEALGLVRTVTLEPEPVPLDVKVVLLGSRLVYYLLSQFDPDFQELFKVEADFDDRMDRDPENETVYARMIAGALKEEELRPFDRSGVARIIERSSRLAGDSEKLSARSREVVDLLREADHWAGEDGADVVTADHVQKTIDQGIYRASRVRDRIHEEILRDTIFVDTDGAVVGQVNGLSVMQLGDFAFGRPNRITARIRLGKGEVVDIEREVELGGPIHSKGVLILSSFLGARYAGERPLSLSASLVFEQSYGGIEGDSASSTELYALLSAIGDVPLKQSIAVTGSVNQHGEVQPIGGVNEKIEGFFDICSGRGLTGEQGVLIPASNVKHLMLRDDVIEAAKDGRFHIWPVETVDQGMELLTGLSMGERQEDGTYPEGTVNQRVEQRLAAMAEKRRAFMAEGGERD